MSNRRYMHILFIYPLFACMHVHAISFGYQSLEEHIENSNRIVIGTVHDIEYNSIHPSGGGSYNVRKSYVFNSPFVINNGNSKVIGTYKSSHLGGFYIQGIESQKDYRGIVNEAKKSGDIFQYLSDMGYDYSYFAISGEPSLNKGVKYIIVLEKGVEPNTDLITKKFIVMADEDGIERIYFDDEHLAPLSYSDLDGLHMSRSRIVDTEDMGPLVIHDDFGGTITTIGSSHYDQEFYEPAITLPDFIDHALSLQKK